jgi:hypothetical protein
MTENTDTIENLLTEITEVAPVVGARSDELRVAVDLERTAESALLAQVRARVQPALRALASRVTSGERTFWPDSVSTATSRSYADWRGLRVAGDGAEYDHPRANDGCYEGEDLFLAADGTWHQLVYTGTWSRWQGAGDSWEAEDKTLTDLDVIKKYDLQTIVETIAEALRKHRDGAAVGKAVSARARAEKISALSELLK